MTSFKVSTGNEEIERSSTRNRGDKQDHAKLKGLLRGEGLIGSLRAKEDYWDEKH